jgi:hypothetical protein
VERGLAEEAVETASGLWLAENTALKHGVNVRREGDVELGCLKACR